MKPVLALALLVPLLVPSCRGYRAAYRGTMPQKVAYVSFTAEKATHWLGGKSFAATGTPAQAAPVTYHMVMKDGAWYMEESSVRPAAGQFYYNDYGSIGAAQAQSVLTAVQGVVTRTRGSAEPSASPGSSARKLFTLAVNSNDGDKAQVRYYESDRAKDKAFRQLLETMRGVGQAEGGVLPLSAQFTTPLRAR